MKHDIGTLNEKSLHAHLKDIYTQPGDRVEVQVDGYVIDIVRGELLIEIQTSNFYTVKKKIRKLVKQNQVRLVYPIAQEKWIIKLPKENDREIQRRKSPKRGCYEDLFRELVRFPELVSNQNFSLEVVLIKEEEIRRFDGSRGWRRKGWITEERQLLEIVNRQCFKGRTDYKSFLPADLPDQFSTQDLAEYSKIPRWLAQKMAYCLRKMELIDPVGSRGRSIVYERVN